MQKIVRKAALTLIEVCIALSLMAIIVYTLFSSLLQTVKISHALDEMKNNALKASFFYDRMLHIFSHTNPESLQIERDAAASKISFSFENGLDPALIFSGKINAEIFCDHNKNLILRMKSKDLKESRTEVLLDNVTECEWEPNLPFFVTFKVAMPGNLKREFVFFFSDRVEGSEAYQI